MDSSDVKRIRTKLGVTQEELADIFGLSGPGVIGNIETGFRNPSRIFVTMLTLLDSLPPTKAQELMERMRLSALLSRDDENPRSSKDLES